MGYTAKEKQITVLAATDQATLERAGADVETTHETIASATARAKYYLTEEYRINSESGVRLGYAQVLVNGKCVADYFAKGGAR